MTVEIPSKEIQTPKGWHFSGVDNASNIQQPIGGILQVSINFTSQFMLPGRLYHVTPSGFRSIPRDFSTVRSPLRGLDFSPS